MMITNGNIRRILCGAIKNDVLIITDNDDAARQIRREIAEFVRFFLSPKITVQVHSEGVNVGGYNLILIDDIKSWNKRERRFPFRGTVLVTDKNLSGVKNIGEGIKTRLLPVEAVKK